MLSEYRVRARNTAAQSENKIHDEAVARRLGFAGAFVPGVTVYGYLTVPVVRALGEGWLARGAATVRFVKPLLDGDEAAVVPGGEGPGGGLGLRVLDPRGETCALATVHAAADGPAPDPAAYPVAAPPPERPEASPAELAPGRVLATTEVSYDEREAADFLEGQSDPLPCYRGPAGLVHPAHHLRLANRALTGTVRVSPWIHVASEVRHLSPARVGERLAVRGRVAAGYERKGRDMVELDLLIVAGAAARPVAVIRHTAIWRLGVPAA